MYMMERFGTKGKGGLCYPNFMAVNFSGFMVGKEVDTNKIVVFAGVKINSINFTPEKIENTKNNKDSERFTKMK